MSVPDGSGAKQKAMKISYPIKYCPGELVPFTVDEEIVSY
jgi:hypothetical protein